MPIIKLLIIVLFLYPCVNPNYFLPIKTNDRKSINTLSLTDIGAFGLLRKERSGVPAHFHTVIDIKRPWGNYLDEPIYPIADGIVISKRQDGPYAQLIIEHGSHQKFWTVYEHIAGIRVHLHENVKPNFALGRFMNKNELKKYGWQFDHLHFEVLKIRPVKLKHDHSNPERHFSSYSLTCTSMEELNKHFHHPIEFLKGNLKSK